MENGQNWCESSCDEVALELFAKNAPDPPHWTLTHVLERFVPFGCIWDRLVALKKLEAKWAKLVQKFVSRRHFGIFRNECNRSTPLEPKLMFWHFSYYFDAFGTVWLAHKTRWKTGRTNAKVRATKSRQNFSQRTHPIHPIGP